MMTRTHVKRLPPQPWGWLLLLPPPPPQWHHGHKSRRLTMLTAGRPFLTVLARW